LLFGQTISELKSEYNSLKMNYLKAVLQSDKEQEARYLQKLIQTGSKIGENTNKYKEELRLIEKHFPKEAKKEASLKKASNNKPSPTLKKAVTKTTPKSSSKYSISSLKTTENSIIINYNRNVNKKDIHFFETTKGSQHRDVFDLKGNFEHAYETKLTLDNVNRVIVSQVKSNTLRIILSHDFNLRTIYIINKRQIIIRVIDARLKQKLQTSLTQNYFKKRSKVVVIDPGHGGRDPGGVGPKKRYEKIVVFKVSKFLYEELKNRGYEVYLTRKSDNNMPLKKRTKFSNDKNADIFISIHTNAIAKSKAHELSGIETFFLSPARSERAKRVAALENQGDMDAMNINSKMTFLTVLNQSKITASNKLAIDIQQNLLHNARQVYKDVVDGGVREGPFWVLVGAQMPSVLVELGYITHPKESKRLFGNNYQRKLARGIANGVDSYFAKNP
jgi:N-acetylmuramoyl-L-alanine amidase